MNNYNIEDLKVEVSRHFPRYWIAIEACLVTIATLLLKDNSNPTSLLLIGRPSSGKTTVLELFKDAKDITYFSDNFTPKAFLSHYANKDKASLEKIDLLRRIVKKCLIVPDFGVIFGKKKEDLRENLGILTRVLDGAGLSTDTGVQGRREFTGDCMFSMIGATTPFGYSLWDEMGRLGARMLFLSMDNNQREIGDVIAEIKEGLSYSDRKEACVKVVGEFVSGFWKEYDGFRSVSWDDSTIPDDLLNKVVNLAGILARLRGMIPKMWVDNIGDYQHGTPTIEDPARVTNLLLNIAKGRALIYGKNQIDKDSVPLLVRIVTSSCPMDRGIIFKELIRRENHEVHTSEVCSLTKVSPKTALQTMRNLEILEIAEISSVSEEGASGRPEVSIRLNKEIEEWVNDSGLQEFIS